MTKRFNKTFLKERRRLLRYNSTDAENVLWDGLRNRKLGYKFIRQYSIDGYVLDFYCPKLKLAIELEGKVHDFTKIYDKYRERYIHEFGIKILKFKNEEIYSDFDLVLNTISLSFPKRGIKGELKED